VKEEGVGEGEDLRGTQKNAGPVKERNAGEKPQDRGNAASQEETIIYQ